MTLLLSEAEVQGLTDMAEVVPTVEECFRQQAHSKASNSPRTRSSSPGSVLNVMHASLQYLGLAGAKCYLGTRKGARFLFVLFRLEDAEPLAVMGADVLGRYRTGAASAVATKFMAAPKSFDLCVCGSGKQALTQVLAMAQVASLESVSVWSPTKAHRDSFAKSLSSLGFDASSFEDVRGAVAEADVASCITSSGAPFLTGEMVGNLDQLNLCGSNSPARIEATPEAVARFKTVVVDDLAQAKVEAGDLMLAERSGLFSWDRAVELQEIVAGRVRPSGPALFKSNGVATEDVAVAGLLYDKAVRAGVGREVDLGFERSA